MLSLHTFTAFAEYFLTCSVLYVLIVAVLIVYSFYGLMIQKAVSECIGLILFMCVFLLLNDASLALDMAHFTCFMNTTMNDPLGFFSKVVICLFTCVYFLVIANSLGDQELTCVEYLLIVLFSVIGLLIQCSANDLLTAYLAIELSSLAFYLMAAFKKSSLYSVEAGLTYFITGSVSSGFFLLGASIIYGTTGSINFTEFFMLFECFHLDFHTAYLFQEPVALKPAIFESNMFIYSQIDPVLVGLSLIIFSMFIKLALAPSHLWSLDVYGGSPTNSTFFFAAISKLSIFTLLLRLCFFSFFSLSWQVLFVVAGVTSIFVGALGGLKQRKLKTLLAYSSISHMGYMAVSFSTSTSMSMQVILFYMLVYMISSVCFWYIILMLQLRRGGSKKYSKEIGDIALLRKSNKALAFALALTMFSIAGVPPLAGFVGKLNIFLTVVGVSYYFVGLFCLVCSAVSTFYYIRIVKIIYFESLLVGKLYSPINSTVKPLILSVLLLMFFLLFFDPSILYLITYKVVLFRRGVSELVQ